ncbi:MAG: glycosidase [Chloroflexota bacterium]|nr:glycosidase [Chloroflexota bacterium]
MAFTPTSHLNDHQSNILIDDLRTILDSQITLSKSPASAAISKQTPAGTLKRFNGNPVLQPIAEHPWESKYVLNAATVNLGRKIYMVYRAFGDDEVSRLGLAVSDDGFKFTERLEDPIFKPHGENEKRGCEDPRLTVIDDRIYMVYTAYDGLIAQIALASIGIKEFLKHQWKEWRRHGLVLPGYKNKDAALFPQRFTGTFGMLHRIEPHIWITFSSDLRCPWPSKCHQILAAPGDKSKWDSRKIGAGAQPIKTEYGWLLITHGVDYQKVYRLGVMLLDLENPTELIYRSPNPILEPTDKWELGDHYDSWVPNVVFSCGATPRENGKETLTADDDLIVYYGAADSVMNIATAKIGELIPLAKNLSGNNKASYAMN